MQFIRQGATHKVVVGPFVDVGDGFTPETGITLSGADEAEAILHDNGTVVDISGYTWAAITTADGYYHLTLQSGISNTVGHLTIVVQDDSVCLPVKAEFTVLEEAVYDQLFASSAPAAATPSALATVDSNVDAILLDTAEIGTAGAGLSNIPWNASWDTEVESEVTDALNSYDPPTKTELDTGFAALNDFDPTTETVDVGAISGDSTAADRLEALMDSILTAAAEGTPTTTVIQTDLAETTNDQYIGRLVTFLTGNAAGEQTDITDYVGSTGTLTVTALANAPSAGDIMVIH